MAYYDFDNDSQSAWATPYPNGSCLSGFIMIPLAVLVVSTFLFLALTNIPTVSSAAIEDTGIGGSPVVFVQPYDEYALTQGPHGYSYGHMAIDIAAGKGATIYSPINGKVTELFIDGVGNPALVIENKVYRVMMLHGVYTVNVGQSVKAGQTVGEESNIGNTTDMQGRSCRNRNCGYHTHLNVYDKRIGTNINPLDLLKP